MLSLVPTPVARPISPACRPARKGIHGGMACAVPVHAVAVLLAVLGMVLLRAADLDNDSLDDAWETSHGYSTLLYTRIVYVDAADGSDSTGDGLAASTAFQTIGKALSQSFTAGDENVVLVAPGTYSGSLNRSLDFNGTDIWLRSSEGAASTVIDLEGAGRLLSLTHGETLSSRLEGFTVRNGYMASYGTAVHLSNASLTVRGCVFEGNRSGRKVVYDYGYGWTETWWQDADSTAAIYASGAPVAIEGCVFRDNTSSQTMYGGMTDNAGALLLVDADGSEITRCAFLGNSGQGAGAVALYGTEALFRDCRFERNLSLTTGGALKASQYWGSSSDSEATLENCLLLGNKALSNHSDLHVGSGCSATLKHVTATGGRARNGNGIQADGDLDAYNSVLDCVLTAGYGAVLQADHCCSPQDLSPYGSGNLRSEAPGLTAAGFLTAASVCRGAGGTAGFLALDIAGNARSQNSIGLGCRAFADTDQDGIPDDVETAAGLNPNSAADAALDADQDGVPNLREYLLGTNPAEDDSDGDGIDDGDELSLGSDPAWPTRTVHVSPDGDDLDDGLSVSTPKATLAAAVELSRTMAWDNLVLLAPGTYSGSGSRSLDFGGYDIRIIGSGGAEETLVDLEDTGRLLSVSSCEGPASLLKGLTVKYGAASGGSAVSVSYGALTVRECVFAECASTGSGTLLAANGGELILEECALLDNTAVNGAALAASSSGSLAVSRTRLEGNRSSSHGGAVHLSGGTAGSFDACRILGNQAGGQSGALYLGGSNTCLELANCLLMGNSATGNFSELRGDSSSQTYGIANCTIVAGSSANGVSCSFAGAADLLNSVFTGNVVFAGTVSASHNCATADWSLHGSGNLLSDPMLAADGLLPPASPCIDAGSPYGAPDHDIFGTARPAGNGFDIGCYEYSDADADGIPDYLETALGLDPLDPDDAALDLDGDGLSNLAEYQLGLDPNSTDTDGDGMPDGWEVQYGLDPTADDAWGDLDGDLLANREEYLHGSRPDLADTDGDGADDWREVLCGLDPADPDDLDSDLDSDGLSSRLEITIYGTNPASPDTDGDGVADGAEVSCGMDPLVPGLNCPYGGGYVHECHKLSCFANASSWTVPASATLASASSAYPGDATAWQIAAASGEVSLDLGGADAAASKLLLHVRSSAGFSVQLYLTDSEDNEYVVQYGLSACGSSSVNGNVRAVGLGTWLSDGVWHPVLIDPTAELAAIAPNADLAAVERIAFTGGLSVGEISLLRYPDADRDGIPDAVETHFGLNPASAADARLDLDSDGLCNLHEFLYSTNMNGADTDGDGLPDGSEVKLLGTDPLSPDQDGDGLPDGWEAAHFNSLARDGSADCDSDGLSDALELLLEGDPASAAVPATAAQLLLELYTVLANLH